MSWYGALQGDDITYHDIPNGSNLNSSKIKESEFPYEKEERDRKYLESRINNKSLKIFDKETG